MKNQACMIYNQRPFACRRIYSLHVCNAERPPVLHRPAMKLADDAIRRLQILDDTGYSGHISFILQMLDNPKFLKTYLALEHRPEEIMQFGKAHQLIINRMVQHK